MSDTDPVSPCRAILPGVDMPPSTMRIVELHLMNLAPVLDLQILPLNGDDDLDEPEPGDDADCNAPQGRVGNDAGAPRGPRRARDHRGGRRYRRDYLPCLPGFST